VIINNAIKKNSVPVEWKAAIVTPLYKNKGNTEDSNSYRGISVLPPIAKIFEKLLCEQIVSYFEDNLLFSKSQHGFRKNASCETALNILFERWKSILDDGEIILSIFIDFQKAFDYVHQYYEL
jgi:hypothetical protein